MPFVGEGKDLDVGDEVAIVPRCRSSTVPHAPKIRTTVFAARPGPPRTAPSSILSLTSLVALREFRWTELRSHLGPARTAPRPHGHPKPRRRALVRVRSWSDRTWRKHLDRPRSASVDQAPESSGSRSRALPKRETGELPRHPLRAPPGRPGPAWRRRRRRRACGVRGVGVGRSRGAVVGARATRAVSSSSSAGESPRRSRRNRGVRRGGTTRAHDLGQSIVTVVPASFLGRPVGTQAPLEVLRRSARGQIY